MPKVSGGGQVDARFDGVAQQAGSGVAQAQVSSITQFVTGRIPGRERIRSVTRQPVSSINVAGAPPAAALLDLPAASDGLVLALPGGVLLLHAERRWFGAAQRRLHVARRDRVERDVQLLTCVWITNVHQRWIQGA